MIRRVRVRLCRVEVFDDVFGEAHLRRLKRLRLSAEEDNVLVGSALKDPFFLVNGSERWFRVAVKEVSPAPVASTTYSRGTPVGKPSGLIGHSGQLPLAEEVLDYTDLVQGASYEEADDPRKIALGLPAVNYPSDETIIVLTEGSSDRIVLENTLNVHYPHFSDLYSLHSGLRLLLLPPGLGETNLERGPGRRARAPLHAREAGGRRHA
jgi:hypothetical protein